MTRREQAIAAGLTGNWSDESEMEEEEDQDASQTIVVPDTQVVIPETQGATAAETEVVESGEDREEDDGSSDVFIVAPTQQQSTSPTSTLTSTGERSMIPSTSSQTPTQSPNSQSSTPSASDSQSSTQTSTSQPSTPPASISQLQSAPPNLLLTCPVPDCTLSPTFSESSQATADDPSLLLSQPLSTPSNTQMQAIVSQDFTTQETPCSQAPPTRPRDGSRHSLPCAAPGPPRAGAARQAMDELRNATARGKRPATASPPDQQQAKQPK